MTRVTIYARISQDDTGLEVGVQDQLKNAREQAAQRGWEVVAEHSDNDISAFKGRERPGYQALMADADARRMDTILVFHTSRLWRNRHERVDGIERLQRAHVSVAAIKGPTLDLTSAYGRGMAGLLGEFDTMESEVKSERVAQAAKRRAEQGSPNGAVPFGWRRVVETNDRGVRLDSRDVLHPEEAPIVAEVCRRLLAGESLRGVTDWLNTTGVPAPGASFQLQGRSRGLTNPDGQQWGKTSVRKLALRAQNCGMRQYHKGREDEQLLPMNAEPIITRDEWDRLRARLTDPARVVHRQGARRHLLSWCEVGKCGVCGGPLAVSTRTSQGGRPPMSLYVCMSNQACVGRNQAYVDAFLRELVIRRLAQADASDLLVSDDGRSKEAFDRAAGLEARLATAADEYADGHIDAAQLRRITERLRPQIEQARQQAADARPDVPVTLLADMAGPLAAERWDALSVVQQNLVVSALFSAVRIMPTARRGPGFDPESVRVEWR